MGVYHWLEQWLAHNALTIEEEKHGSLVNPTEEDARGRVRSVVLEMGDWVGAGKIRPPKILDLSRLTFSGTRRRYECRIHALTCSRNAIKRWNFHHGVRIDQSYRSK